MLELIVAIGIFTFVGMAIVVFQQSVLRNTKFLQSNLIAQQQARKTLATFSAEIRAAAPSASGGYAIESAGTSSIVFYSNIDGGTDVERVRYFLSTSTSPTVFNVIKKGVVKPVGTTYTLSSEKTVTLVNDIRNSSSSPLFSYFDKYYAGTTSAMTVPINISAVRHVKMEIVVDPNSTRSPAMQYYRTQVSIRNLKDNY
jgi:type II secretory pathway pseudopilin PulG